MKTLNARIFQYLIILSFGCFLNMNQGMSQICGDTTKYRQEVQLSSMRSNSTELEKANKEYEIFAGKNVAACKNPENCSEGSKCELSVVKVLKLPNARQERHSKKWEFPPAKVIVIYECPCQSTVVVTIFDDVPVEPDFEIGDFKNNNSDDGKRAYVPNHDINVYPNPTQNDLQIDVNDLDVFGTYEIRIYNTIGTLMESKKINISEKSQRVYEVKTSDYASGMYYLIISDGTKIVNSTRFAVSRG